MWPYLVGAAGAVLGAGGAYFHSMWPTSQLYGRTLIAGLNPQELALTYDDGPNGSTSDKLLDLLGEFRVQATFFLMGDFARQQPTLVKRMVAEGHLVANHTMSHPALQWQSATEIRQQLFECSRWLEDLTGEPVRYFRPPFGGRRPVVLRIARELGLTPVTWNVTAYDWRGGITTGQVFSHIEKGIAKNRAAGHGSNILLHDGGHLGLGANRDSSVEATRMVLEKYAPLYSDTGFRFVKVDAWG